MASEQASGEAASRLIDRRIEELGDWRSETLSRMRGLILSAAPGTVEEWKWMGTPVWSNHGILCTGESYKQYVKLTFAHGAALPDPKKLFNASLEGGTRRAIDIREGEVVDATAFQALVQAAIARNAGAKAAKAKPAARAKPATPSKPAAKSKSPAKAQPAAQTKSSAKAKAPATTKAKPATKTTATPTAKTKSKTKR